MSNADNIERARITDLYKLLPTVNHHTPKPWAAGSIPVSPAKDTKAFGLWYFSMYKQIPTSYRHFDFLPTFLPTRERHVHHMDISKNLATLVIAEYNTVFLMFWCLLEKKKVSVSPTPCIMSITSYCDSF